MGKGVPLLSRPLALHDLRDTERLCRQVLDRYSGRFSADEFEGALVYLVETAREISLSYEPTRDRQPDFASYAGRILDRRIHDWLRKRHGRTRWAFKDHVYERRRPVVLSLDAPAGHGERDPLGSTLADRAGDSPPDRSAALAGLLAHGHSSTDRDFRLHREAAARRARG
jgi:hypothetical protein